jgi:DNA-binding NtrC family response regulator
MGGGEETILLAEDEAAVRKFIEAVLKRKGYKVFAAASGVEALKVWPECRAEVDLLITDMVMPEGISGRELADRLSAEKPGLKVLYCTGYSDDMLGKDSPRNGDLNVLEKPFGSSLLLKRIRDILDEP